MEGLRLFGAIEGPGTAVVVLDEMVKGERKVRESSNFVILLLLVVGLDVEAQSWKWYPLLYAQYMADSN